MRNREVKGGRERESERSDKEMRAQRERERGWPVFY